MDRIVIVALWTIGMALLVVGCVGMASEAEFRDKCNQRGGVAVDGKNTFWITLVCVKRDVVLP